MQVDPRAESLSGLSPYNSMNNNPIAFSDPEGDIAWFAPLVGAGINVISNGLSNISNGNGFFQGAGGAAFWGAISGTASAGIGDLFGHGLGSVQHEIGRGLAHGFSGGIQSALQGGGFGSGFLSGGLSSGIGSGIGALGGGAFDQILGGGLSGGLGSVIGGGSFFDGLSQGLAVGALNHAASSLFQGGQGDPPSKEDIRMWLAGEWQNGTLSPREYTNAIILLDDGALALIKHVLYNYRGEIALSVVPGGKVLKGGSRVIKGFSKHGLNQAITRGFQTKDILNIVRNGSAVSAMGRYGTQVRYTLGRNTVVVNNSGKVVTVFSSTKNGIFVR